MESSTLLAPKRKLSNVVTLFEYTALCPECDGVLFRMFTKGPEAAKDGYVKIIGTECVNCETRVNWT